MDLRTPVVPEDRLHPNFRALTTPGHFEEEWGTLQRWAEGFVDRDHKFVKEFQTTFNSSFWELYLHAAFRELGFEADFAYSRPDFVLSRNEERAFSAEAVIASHGDGYCPEWKRSLDDFDELDREEIVHIGTIRLANAIWSKHKKYIESYSTLDHVDNLPFVICVAPFEQPLFFAQNDNALRRVLYGFDQPLWIPGQGDERIPVGESSLPEVIKDNGQAIPLGFFTSPLMAEVSGVIFSNTATVTKVRALTENSPVQSIITAVRYCPGSAGTGILLGRR